MDTENINNTGLTVVSNGIMTNDQIKQFRTNLENFTSNLNKKPAPKSVVKHKENYEYIPISFIEKDLDRLFFGLVQYELLSFQQIFNEVVVTARIKVFHPVLNSWMQYDGIGSAVIQQDANSTLMDFNNTKKKNALKLAAPIAYAEAKKNAAKQLGKRFGSDLNRKEGFVDDYRPFGKPQEDEDNKPLNK